MKKHHIIKMMAVTIILIAIEKIRKGKIIPNSSDTIITPTYDTMIRFYHPEFANCNSFFTNVGNFALTPYIMNYYYGIYFNFYNDYVHPPVYDSVAGAWRAAFQLTRALFAKNDYFP